MQHAATQESIVDRIKKDHRKTGEEIRELEKRTRGRREDSLDPVFAPMKKELLGHMTAEEKLLYPLLGQEMRQQMQDARRKHEEIRKHFKHLTAGGSMPEEEWARHLQMMKRGIEHHVQDEESRILPAARRIAGGSEVARSRDGVRADGRAGQVDRSSGGRDCRHHHFSFPYGAGPEAGMTMCARRYVPRNRSPSGCMVSAVRRARRRWLSPRESTPPMRAAQSARASPIVG